jgi:hypothetical protein
MKKQTTAAACEHFEQMPNIGKSMAQDFHLLGLKRPQDLAGRDPWVLYCKLCKLTQSRQDPCVLDTFIAAVRFMEGGPATPWWDFTTERKRDYSQKLERFFKTFQPGK